MGSILQTNNQQILVGGDWDGLVGHLQAFNVDIRERYSEFINLMSQDQTCVRRADFRGWAREYGGFRMAKAT